jgi:hypothetical protein
MREVLGRVVEQGASRAERVGSAAFGRSEDPGQLSRRLRRWREVQTAFGHGDAEEKHDIRGYGRELRERSLTTVRLLDAAMIPEWAVTLVELVTGADLATGVTGSTPVAALLAPVRSSLVRIIVDQLRPPDGVKFASTFYQSIILYVNRRWLDLLDRCAPLADTQRGIAGRNIVGVLVENPALARAFAERVSGVIRAARLFARHYSDDVGELVRAFGLDAHAAATLSHLDLGRGDSHCLGTTVAVVTIGDGTRIVYKPKDLTASLWFRQYADEVCRRLPSSLRLRFPDTIARAGHGWMRFEDEFACTTRDEAEKFFGRAGVLTALSQAAGARDLHGENIFACGSFPVPIDLEVLASPRPDLTGRPGPERAAAEALLYSPLQPGILPELRVGADESVMYDGALPSKHPQAGRAALCTPILDGKAACLEDHLDAFVDGYQSCLEQLFQLRASNRVRQLERNLTVCRVRYVPRTTDLYDKLLTWAWRVADLTDAPDVELMLERIVCATPLHSRELVALADEEVWALSHGDIPFFTTVPGRTTVRGCHGEEQRAPFRPHPDLRSTIALLELNKDQYVDMVRASIAILRL